VEDTSYPLLAKKSSFLFNSSQRSTGGDTVYPNVPVKTGTRHGGLPAPFINVLLCKTLGEIPCPFPFPNIT